MRSRRVEFDRGALCERGGEVKPRGSVFGQATLLA
jgi:hypothetical protein